MVYMFPILICNSVPPLNTGTGQPSLPPHNHTRYWMGLARVRTNQRFASGSHIGVRIIVIQLVF